MIGPRLLRCKTPAIAAAMVVAMAAIGIPSAAQAQQSDPREQAQDALRRGDHERARLARARLRDAHHIFAVQASRDRLHLNRRRCHPSESLDRRKALVGELHV